MGTGKLEWSLQSLQGLLNKGLSQSGSVKALPRGNLVVQKLSLAATILGALGMTYKLSSKK